MKRIALIFGAIALWTSLCTSCYFATKIISLKYKCNVYYDYIDTNGNKNNSNYCFESETGLVCKKRGKGIKVNKYNKIKICKKEG